MTPKQKALKDLENRKKHPPERIDNSSLYAGSPMYYYCKLCGWLAATLPESHSGRPPQLCKECSFMKEMGWLE